MGGGTLRLIVLFCPLFLCALRLWRQEGKQAAQKQGSSSSCSLFPIPSTVPDKEGVQSVKCIREGKAKTKTRAP